MRRRQVDCIVGMSTASKLTNMSKPTKTLKQITAEDLLRVGGAMAIAPVKSHFKSTDGRLESVTEYGPKGPIYQSQD